MELVKPLESKVVPALLKFVAKKQRLLSIKKILKEYVQSIYWNQSITPVRCISADPLTDEQKAAITQKMAKKLGCADVKLEYGFTDPDTLKYCSDGEDCTLRNFLERSAI